MRHFKKNTLKDWRDQINKTQGKVPHSRQH
jgi:hypothetical protein